jgi:hypothetical protein
MTVPSSSSSGVAAIDLLVVNGDGYAVEVPGVAGHDEPRKYQESRYAIM